MSKTYKQAVYNNIKGGRKDKKKLATSRDGRKDKSDILFAKIKEVRNTSVTVYNVLGVPTMIACCDVICSVCMTETLEISAGSDIKRGP
mmetsp:Transcript_33508/g.54326  ORF Transcript_33508/g.54326 Transcript_33508/m.54326 type:complete len:89 (+) Transcript_33508:142-408(+)